AGADWQKSLLSLDGEKAIQLAPAVPDVPRVFRCAEFPAVAPELQRADGACRCMNAGLVQPQVLCGLDRVKQIAKRCRSCRPGGGMIRQGVRRAQTTCSRRGTSCP